MEMEMDMQGCLGTRHTYNKTCPPATNMLHKEPKWARKISDNGWEQPLYQLQVNLVQNCRKNHAGQSVHLHNAIKIQYRTISLIMVHAHSIIPPRRLSRGLV